MKIKRLPGRTARPKLGVMGWVLQIFLLFYAFISLYPLIWLLFYSLKNNNEIFITNPFGFPTNFRIENYITALNAYDVPVYFKNSIIVTVCTVVGTVLLSLMFSYAVARMRFRFQEQVRMYLMLGLFIPLQVVMIPLAILMRDLHVANTRWAVIIPYTAFNLAFTSMVLYGHLRGIPTELEESACIDGASIFTCFWKIIVPIIRPAIATCSIFVFMNAWNEFNIALIMLTNGKLKTLPLGLMFFQGEFTTDWGAMGAAMVIASIPTILIYILLSEQVEKAMTVGSAVKG